MYLSYVYYIKNKITNQFYYGYRCGNISEKRTPAEDFWIFYYTSSPKISKLISEHGYDSFETKIILEQDTSICFWYEQLLIRENINNPNCLNNHYIDPDKGKNILCKLGYKNSEETKKRKSDRQRGELNLMAKSFELTSPDLKKFIVTGGLVAFCKEHNLAFGSFSHIDKINGYTVTGGRNEGWHIKEISYSRPVIVKQKRYRGECSKKWIITPPQCESIIVSNLPKFCKQYNIDYSFVAYLGKNNKVAKSGHLLGWIIVQA